MFIHKFSRNIRRIWNNVHEWKRSKPRGVCSLLQFSWLNVFITILLPPPTDEKIIMKTLFNPVDELSNSSPASHFFFQFNSLFMQKTFFPPLQVLFHVNLQHFAPISCIYKTNTSNITTSIECANGGNNMEFLFTFSLLSFQLGMWIKIKKKRSEVWNQEIISIHTREAHKKLWWIFSMNVWNHFLCLREEDGCVGFRLWWFFGEAVEEKFLFHFEP